MVMLQYSPFATDQICENNKLIINTLHVASAAHLAPGRFPPRLQDVISRLGTLGSESKRGKSTSLWIISAGSGKRGLR